MRDGELFLLNEAGEWVAVDLRQLLPPTSTDPRRHELLKNVLEKAQAIG